MKKTYIQIKLDPESYNPEVIDSFCALPDIDSCKRFYPDDPALHNILLATTDLAKDDDSLQELIKTLSQVDKVLFIEIIDKPIPR